MEQEPRYSVNDIVEFINELGNYCYGVVVAIYIVGRVAIYDIEINDDYLGTVVKRGIMESEITSKK